jgi:hypothetical protein
MRKKLVCIVLISIFFLLSLNFSSVESKEKAEHGKNTVSTTFEVYVYRFGLFQNYLKNVDLLIFNKIGGEKDRVEDVSGNGFKKDVSPGLYVIRAKANANGLIYRGFTICYIHSFETKEAYVMVSPSLI